MKNHHINKQIHGITVSIELQFTAADSRATFDPILTIIAYRLHLTGAAALIFRLPMLKTNKITLIALELNAKRLKLRLA
jgi:hypothetical protein